MIYAIFGLMIAALYFYIKYSIVRESKDYDEENDRGNIMGN